MRKCVVFTPPRLDRHLWEALVGFWDGGEFVTQPSRR